MTSVVDASTKLHSTNNEHFLSQMPKQRAINLLLTSQLISSQIK